MELNVGISPRTNIAVFAVEEAVIFISNSEITLKTIFVCLLGLLATACDSSSDSETQITIEDWKAQAINSYTFEYKSTGFAPLAGDEWEIQVHNGEVIYVNYLGEGNPREELMIEFAPTVDSLFNEISNCDSKDSCEVSEQHYDEKYYYPTKYTGRVLSESVGFEVSGFVIQ